MRVLNIATCYFVVAHEYQPPTNVYHGAPPVPWHNKLAIGLYLRVIDKLLASNKHTMHACNQNPLTLKYVFVIALP